MEHLNGVYEQSATSCLMVTQTNCVPGAEVVSMAHRGSKHTSAMLDRTDQTDRAMELVLATPT